MMAANRYVLHLTYVILVAYRAVVGFDLSVTGSCTTAGCVQSAYDVLQLVNLTADPCTDFYQFACGTYINTVYMGESFGSAVQYGDKGIQDMIAKTTSEMLKQYPDDTTPPSEQKAIKYYESCKSAKVDDASSTTFLRGYVQEVGGFYLTKREDVPANWSLEWLLTRSLSEVGTALFKFSVEVDSRNTSRNGLVFTTETTPVFNSTEIAGNLTDDDIYLQEVKDAYFIYLKDFMKKLLVPDSYKEMRDHYLKEMVDFEFELAKISPALEDGGDSGNDDMVFNDHTETDENKFSVSLAQLQALTTPGFNWTVFFRGLAQKYKANSLSDTSNLFVSYRGQTYFQKLAQLINATLNGPNKLNARRAIHNYVAFRNLVTYLDDMSCSYSNRLKKIREMALGNSNADDFDSCSDSSRTPSDCIEETKKVYTQVLSRRFISTYFQQSVGNLTQMANAVRDSFIAELQQLSWMDDQTKANGLLKIKKMVFSIGYPPDLFDPTFEKKYDRLAVFDDFLTSRESAKHYMKANELRSLDEPANRIDCSWIGIDPTIQNAFYHPLCNAFVILAGIAVPPSYRYGAAPAFNWGRLAPIIGHEMSHGFDNSGAKYNDVGLFSNWWTNQSLTVFEQRYSCLVDQFNELNDNSTTYGNQVLGEAIADNGGIKISYNAFKKTFGDDYLKQVTMPGLPLTNEQIFFLAVSQQFCYAMDFFAKSMFMSDEHPFPTYRINGMMANFEPWANAYNCPVGSPMNPAGRTRCDVW